MAAPNFLSLTTINGKATGVALTTAAATIINNAALSGKCLKVNTLIVSNIDGTNSADVTINYYTLDDIGGTAYAIAKTVAVGPDSSLVVIDKNSPIYLEEDKSIGGLASANGDLEVVASWEDMS